LTEQLRYVSVHRQGLEIDDTQKELTIKDTKLDRQIIEQGMEELTHG